MIGPKNRAVKFKRSFYYTELSLNLTRAVRCEIKDRADTEQNAL